MGRRNLRIGLVQMSMTLDKTKNVSRAATLVGEAASGGAEIVCLPELFSTTYFPSSRHASPSAEPIPGPTSRALALMAKKNGIVVVGGSIFEGAGARHYNTSVVFGEDGGMLGKYRKVHIPQDEHYYEQDYFSSGDEYCVAETSKGRFGVLICFDQWYPEAARINRLMGAQALFYPTAIGWVKGIEQTEGDWRKAWETVQVGHAIANSMVVCSVNRVGTEGSTTFWGSSFVCDQFGKILLRGGEDEGAFVVDCSLDLGEDVEEGWGFLRNRKPRTYGRIAE